MQIKLTNKTGIKSKSGFTTIELIVVISLFSIMTGMVLFRYRDFGAGITLQNTAQEIALQIQKAQNFAVSGRYPKLANSSQPAPIDGWRPSYGVYFNISSPKQFVFFFDANNGLSDFLSSYGTLSGRGYYNQSSTSTAIGDSVYACGLGGDVNDPPECLDVLTIGTNESIYDLCTGPASGDCGKSNISMVFTRPFPDRIAVYNSSIVNGGSLATDTLRVRVRGEGASGCRDIIVTPLGQISIATVACPTGGNFNQN